MHLRLEGCPVVGNVPRRTLHKNTQSKKLNYHRNKLKRKMNSFFYAWSE
jgi:hypothetical protein